MALELTTSYLKDATELFRYYKRLAERAIEQVPDEKLFAVPNAKSNSIAITVKHMAGNMRFALDGLFDHGWRKADPQSRHRI